MSDQPVARRLESDLRDKFTEGWKTAGQMLDEITFLVKQILGKSDPMVSVLPNRLKVLLLGVRDFVPSPEQMPPFTFQQATVDIHPLIANAIMTSLGPIVHEAGFQAAVLDLTQYCLAGYSGFSMETFAQQQAREQIIELLLKWNRMTLNTLAAELMVANANA